jgi:hypothetical protein
MFNGKRRSSFLNLKSSFAVKDREFLFSVLLREKKVFKDEIEIIEAQLEVLQISVANPVTHAIHGLLTLSPLADVGQ